MNRWLVTAAIPIWLSLGCVGPEQELVDRFLDASQRGDNQTVAALSMVAFPDDVVSWNALEISEARHEPYEVPALLERVGDAEEERDAQFKEFGEFRQENYETLRTIQGRLREDAAYQFSGRLLELRDRWDVYRAERRAVVAKLHESELELEAEIRRVNTSLQRESTPEYLTGETLNKVARLRVTTPGGDAHYDVRLTQYQLRNQFESLVPARWIITTITKAQ